MAYNPAKPVAASMMNDPDAIELQKIKERKSKFLASLYPSGRSYDEIVKQIEKEKNMSRSDAVEAANGKLSIFKKEKLIDVIDRKGDDQSVILTKEGKTFLFQYMAELRDSDKEKYFTYLKKWVDGGDDPSEKLYRAEIRNELRSNLLIVCNLVKPWIDSNIVSACARIGGVDPDAKLSGQVHSVIGKLVMLNLIAFKKKKLPDNSSQTYYYIPDTAIPWLKELLEDIRSNKDTIRQDVKTKSPKMDVEKKIKYWLLAMVSFVFSLVTGFSSEVGDVTLGYMMLCALMPVGFLMLIEFLIPILLKAIKSLKK